MNFKCESRIIFCVTNKYFFVNTIHIYYVYCLLKMDTALTLVFFEIYIIVIVEIYVVLKVILKINVIFVSLKMTKPLSHRRMMCYKLLGIS